jgi:tetratricopeptide (TPR) repeat protein
MGARRIVLALLLVLAGLPLAAHADDWSDCIESDPDRTIQACTSVIEAGTKTGGELEAAYSFRADNLRRKGSYDLAIKDYSQVIAMNPNEPTTYNNRGLTYHDIGDIDLAIKDFDKAITLNPKLEFPYNSRGNAYSSKGNFDRAVKDFDRASVLKPEAAYAHSQRCWLRAILGSDLNTARKACNTALKLEKGNPNFLDSRGLVGLKQKQYQKAWADYNAAVKAKPDGAAHYLYGRGVAALRLGRTEEGKADLAKALQLDPKIAKTYESYGVTP